MNIYLIHQGHAAPKDWNLSNIGFVIAENDEQVFNYIASQPVLYGVNLFNSWEDKDEEFKQKMIEIGGEVNDESVDFADAYYGITLYGWSLITKDIYVDELYPAIKLGILTSLV
jgi:hypothetical protein